MLPEPDRKLFLKGLSEAERERLAREWRYEARDDQQIEPFLSSNKIVWLLLAGRGYGKTRVGAETIKYVVERGIAKRIALIGETAADARKVMIEGNAGILAVSRPDFMPTYKPSNRELHWTNGAIATSYNATEPDQLRGPAHDFGWCDELAKWQYMQDCWDNFMFGLRLGLTPRAVVTTTPRPLQLIKELLKDPTTYVTRGSTYDNIDNLAPAFAQKIISKYKGTRLGRQELDAEVLDDVPGALWKRDDIDLYRVARAPRDLRRIVVSIDPAVTSGEDANDTGIVVCGKDQNGHGYVLEDGTCHESPAGWGKAAVDLYRKWKADRIIGEVNNGGEMIEHVVRSIDTTVSYKAVRASRGKVARAEPISALYEQGKVHHVGSFPELEDQMCEFTHDFDKDKAGYSPDRMEAMVWGMTELVTRKGFFDGIQLAS